MDTPLALKESKLPLRKSMLLRPCNLTEEETAFRRLQNELTSDRLMAYFDPKKPTDVLVDASSTGLGAILIQDGKVISYGSRALSDVETRYSQTEREMLAVVWATEHYHLYLYGAKFTVITSL